MSTAYQLDVGELSTLTCGVHGCGIAFAIPAPMHRERKEDGRTFWCPNGHEISYIDSEAKKLRRELERKQKELEWAKQATERAREDARRNEARRRSTKAAATKLRQRIEGGKCPHCSATFANVAAHMRKAHAPQAQQTPESHHE